MEVKCVKGGKFTLPKKKRKKERTVRKIDSIGSVRSAKNRNHTKPNEKKPLSVENGKS